MDEVNVKGLSNCYQVSKVLFRSAQPTREGFYAAQKMGIRSIINLRWIHGDWRRTRGLGFLVYHIRCKAWHPEREDVERFLGIMGMKRNVPALVHCRWGSDRTGMMVAAYRIFHEGWGVDRAIEEMEDGPFGFNVIWHGIPEFLEGFRK